MFLQMFPSFHGCEDVSVLISSMKASFIFVCVRVHVSPASQTNTEFVNSKQSSVSVTVHFYFMNKGFLLTEGRSSWLYFSFHPLGVAVVGVTRPADSRLLF